MLTQQQIEQVLAIAVAAGQRSMDFFQNSSLKIVNKQDGTPLSQADIAVQKVINEGLQRHFGQWPQLSEESATIDFAERRHWRRYWLIDPLDGTKEFIDGRVEFTVNIALVVNGKVAFGVVYWPPTGTLYWGGSVYGSYLQETGDAALSGQDRLDLMGFTATFAQTFSNARRRPLAIRRVSQRTKVIPQHLALYVSRSHGLNRLEQLTARLDANGIALQQRSVGSSLKCCWIAAGEGDLYPRFGPTSEWDTAAAQAILNGVGGDIKDFEGNSLRYNQQQSLLNPDFYAYGDDQVPWQALLTD